ncbi:MAG: patatin-like phospholipase family protein [Firmicutes bacterium]|nr:patatin-like phospholipase family protein [Bacillota bacterium]
MPSCSVGLALGSGAFRGLAHIGVLDVFEREGIQVDRIAGTSVGALIGAAYVSGCRPAEMEARAKGLNETLYYDIVIPRQGVLAGKRLEALVEEMTEGRTFAQANIPFAVVACDFAAMETVVLRDGPMHEAVRASVSIPGVFVPVEREGRMLVDGGIVDRVPADVCRAMGADIVIGVDVGYRGQRVETSGIIEHVLHAYDILEWQVAQRHVSEADLMITPDVVGFNPARMGGRALECVERGRAAARAALGEVRALIEKARPT